MNYNKPGVPPRYAFQEEDLPWVIGSNWGAVFYEQGMGKVRLIVDAVNRLQPDYVLVLTPAMCRGVWQDPDPELSDIAKYSIIDPFVYAYNCSAGKSRAGSPGAPTWIVATLEAIAYPKHFNAIKNFFKELGKGPDICIVDEGTFISNPRAGRTSAAIKLGQLAKRRYILNGTPVTKDEMGLWGQYEFLSPSILGYRNYYHFRANHAVLGGYQDRQVVKTVNMDYVYKRTAPYTRRRLKKDHLKDLPQKIYCPPIEVPLSTETWKLYKAMRTDMIAMLGSTKGHSIAISGGVAFTRLGQITGGFLGGVEEPTGRCHCGQEISVSCCDQPAMVMRPAGGVYEISCEKTDFLVKHLKDQGRNYPIVWCRFQPEIQRLVKKLSLDWNVFQLHGLATERQRAHAKEVFKLGLGTKVEEPCVLVGHPGAAGVGNSYVKSNSMYYLSQEPNYWYRSQSEDRIHRGGQRFPCTYQDICAVGPDGQKTVDHKIRKILLDRTNLSELSSAAWINLLAEE